VHYTLEVRMALETWVRIITEQSGNEANSTAWNETKENDLE